MRLIKYIYAVITIFSFSCSKETVNPNFISEGTYDGKYFPTNEWRYCSPEEVGVNTKALSEAHTYISNSNFGTDGYMIIKDGYVVAEDYFNDLTSEIKHSSYSIAKSFTSAIIGIAIDQGYIESVDDKFSDYFGELNNDSTQQWKKELGISHVLTMTSGINWTEEGIFSNDIIQMSRSEDYLEDVMNKPLKNKPGTDWSYNSGESMYLSGLINLLTGKSLLQYAEENLLNPIGINNINWIADSKNHTVAGWGIDATMHDFAKFGYLFLNNGNWDGKQIISEEWIMESTSAFSDDYPFYGYLWWLGEDAFFESTVDLPDDLYMAIGAFGQYLVIVPSKNLIIVRLGQDLYTQNSWKPEEFIRLVLEAV